MTDNEFNDYVSTVTKIVTLAMAVAATIATPASIAIVLMASSQRVVGAPMPRMTPEAVAEPEPTIWRLIASSRWSGGPESCELARLAIRAIYVTAD